MTVRIYTSTVEAIKVRKNNFEQIVEWCKCRVVGDNVLVIRDTLILQGRTTNYIVVKSNTYKENVWIVKWPNDKFSSFSEDEFYEIFDLQHP